MESIEKELAILRSEEKQDQQKDSLNLAEKLVFLEKHRLIEDMKES